MPLANKVQHQRILPFAGCRLSGSTSGRGGSLDLQPLAVQCVGVLIGGRTSIADKRPCRHTRRAVASCLKH
ncbi:MAG: hypothetical protein JWP89_2994 [Schlesneria sp.]|nr:hypothetical protein [Schlesneria sp.]